MRAVEAEQLRQERETFDLRKRHAAAWFQLRLVIGYGALSFTAIVAMICMAVLCFHHLFPPAFLSWTFKVLMADLLGLAATVIMAVLNPAGASALTPVTKAN